MARLPECRSWIDSSHNPAGSTRTRRPARRPSRRFRRIPNIAASLKISRRATTTSGCARRQSRGSTTSRCSRASRGQSAMRTCGAELRTVSSRLRSHPRPPMPTRRSRSTGSTSRSSSPRLRSPRRTTRCARRRSAGFTMPGRLGASPVTPRTGRRRAGRLGALVAAARAGIEAHEREQAERRAAMERDASLRQAREAICERLEQVRGEEALEAIERARAEWEGMPAPATADSQDDQTRARFEEACGRAAERHQNLQERGRIHGRLAELAAEADRLSNAEERSVDEWNAVQREWTELYPGSEDLDPATREQYAAAEARVRLRAEEKRAAAERTLKQQVQRLDQLVDRANSRAGAEDLTLREADRIARELRTALDAPPVLPERDQQALLERLRAAQAAMSPKLHELREMDEWKRFANAAVQEELIAKTEALRAKYGFDTPEGIKPEDVEKAARELHEIQERWKQAAEAPRAQAQTLWHRYRQAADPIQAKARDFFAARAVEREANLKLKLELCERAEALADSTDWIKTADELKKLQAEWQAIGPVPRQDTRV